MKRLTDKSKAYFILGCMCILLAGWWSGGATVMAITSSNWNNWLIGSIVMVPWLLIVAAYDFHLALTNTDYDTNKKEEEVIGTDNEPQ